MATARHRGGLVVGLALVMLSGCGSVQSPVPSQGRSPATQPFSPADVQRAVDGLASLGIETRVRPSDPLPITAVTGGPSPIRLLRLQVRNLALEQAAGSGTRGADLDRLSNAAGGGAISPLVAGWATSGATPAARWAASLLGHWTPGDPAARVFPTLTLVAFVADASGASGQTSDRPDAGVGGMLNGPRMGMSASRPPVTLATSSGFCADVSAYLSAALNGIVDSTAGVPAWLKQLIDLYAPQYANNPGLLRRTIGALALMSYATSLARPWNVDVVPDPAAITYGIVGENPVEGDVQVSVATGNDVFATDVADCATLANAQLASAMEPILNAVMRPSGFAVIDVTYHMPKASPSPSAAPSAPSSALPA